MKLRFEVNLAECFRKGIDCPHSMVTVEVSPANLPQEQRDLIADRLEGIDVCQLGVCVISPEKKVTYHKLFSDGQPKRVIAAEPTFEALLAAVRRNQADCEKERQAQIQRLKTTAPANAKPATARITSAGQTRPETEPRRRPG